MGLLDDIKTQVKKAGANKAKLAYFKSGVKNRMRFLSDMEDGIKIPFHDSFALGVNEPCQLIFGRDCPNCDNEELRHRDLYAWSAFDYEANEVKIVLAAVNNASPVPQLVAAYETYGTMTDRDYVITKQGAQTNTTFTVMPMDKVKFRNEKAKPFSKAKLLDLVDKAFPGEGSGEEPAKGNKKPKKPASKPDPEDTDYDEMTPKQLYDLCVEKEIDVEIKKGKQYYIDALVEHDMKNAAGDDDEWGDEEPDYDSMTPKALYDLCKEKSIAAEPKKTKEYYIDLLKGTDDDGWGEEPDEDGGW